MKTTTPGSFFLLLAAAWPLAGQTTPPASGTAHRTAAATAAHHTAAGGCVTAPTISPKIPAVPASAPCVKALFTITTTPTTKLDYASPLVSREIREELGSGPETYSLDYVDTQAGTGATAAAGKWLSVHYTGYLAADGTKFDSSHDHPGGQPISFPYGTHQVILGWDTGFEGMKIGGKRRLFIPWQLAYGEAGHRPVIPARAELVFDVELVSQSDQRPTPPPMPRPTPPAGVHPPTGATPQPPAGSTPPPTSSTTPPPSGSTPQTAPKPQ
jgi:peptidylprolyl isomerase